MDDNYSGSVSPVLGVSLDIGLSRNQNKWHIVNELLYKSYKTGSSFTRPYGSGYTVNSAVDLTFSYVQLNTKLRYIFPTGSFLRPFINAGVGNGFIVAENKNNLHRVYSFGSEEDVKAIDEPKKYEFSLVGGAGLYYRKIQLELSYAANKKGFSPAITYNVNPKSIQALFTYQF